jgi:uncharacterized protein
MLIAFRVANFRSFKDEQELNYITSPDRAHETTHCIRTGIRAPARVSRAALVFGPNAGGKTNLVVALATLRDLVLNSSSLTDAQFAERHTPFKFESQDQRPTQFEIEVLLDRVRYRYLVAYDATRVLGERLLVFRTGKSQRWFKRDYNPRRQLEEWEPFSPSFHGPREVWRQATRPRTLFLTTAAQLDAELLQPLFRWFAECIEIVSPRDIVNSSGLAAQLGAPNLKPRVLEVVNSAGIPITDFRPAEPDFGSSNGHDGRRSMEFLHVCGNEPPMWLNSTFEAAGVNQLFGLVAPMLRTVDAGKLLVIDDFDMHLHPLVAKMLMQLIQHPAMAKRGAQLLLTSHNATLMDLDILRRDEIWLLELDPRQSSRLTSLTLQSPRKHEIISKAYLRGRYGAIPQTQYARVADTSTLKRGDIVVAK